MKLNEVKEFVKELRGLSQEELAKRENELKKELFDFVSKQLLVNWNKQLA